jgi:arginyl-tRNA synthetase
VLSQLIRTSLEQSVQQVFSSLSAAAPEHLNIALEQPANPDFGDYSSNIAMQLAKVLRKAPMAIAELITAELGQQGAI